MRASLVLAAAIAAVTSAGRMGREAEATTVDRHAIGHRAEVQRIQAHFDSVLSELRARDVNELTPNQKAERSRLVGVLTAYRDRGVFPHNRHFPGEAIPYFVDRSTGTLCAVAHLLESTGRRDIVDAVAAMDNNVWVNDLAGNSEFETWLNQHGLTLAEAARIQVPYVDDGWNNGSQQSPTLYSRPAATAIMGATAAVSLWNAFVNRNGQQGIASLVGIAAGVGAATYGSSIVSTGNAPRGVGALSIAAGGVSAFLATRGFLRQRHLAEAKKAQLAARTTVTPIVPLDGKSGAGLSVSIRF